MNTEALNQMIEGFCPYMKYKTIRESEPLHTNCKQFVAMDSIDTATGNQKRESTTCDLRDFLQGHRALAKNGNQNLYTNGAAVW